MPYIDINKHTYFLRKNENIIKIIMEIHNLNLNDKSYEIKISEYSELRITFIKELNQTIINRLHKK